MAKAKKLTIRQRIFVEQYLLTKNGTKAAIAAGYSPKTAKMAASETLTKPYIKALIETGLRKERQKLDLDALAKGVTKERWLEEIAKVAFASIDQVATVINNDVHAIATSKRDPRLGSIIKKVSAGKYGPTVELHNKLGALETLGRALDWVKDKKELTGKDGKPLHPDNSPKVIVMLPPKGGKNE